MDDMVREIEVLHAIKLQRKYLLIFSDFLSALQSLASLKITIQINFYILETKSKYDKFVCESFNNSLIKFYWILFSRNSY